MLGGRDHALLDSTLLASPEHAQPEDGRCQRRAHAEAHLHAEQSLPGAVASNNSVITKATCYKRTVVHHAAAGVYTVECTAYYSDGTSVTGYANLLLAQDKITWEPTS